MISRKHATRILALLLAVLLFGQLAAFQLPVSAASAVPATTARPTSPPEQTSTTCSARPC